MDTNRSGYIGFENRIIAIISMVSALLINMAFTLRFKLPGISPGAFKKAPMIMAGAYCEYPKTYKTPKGVNIERVNRIPLEKLELFKNSSSCLKCSFTSSCNLKQRYFNCNLRSAEIKIKLAVLSRILITSH